MVSKEDTLPVATGPPFVRSVKVGDFQVFLERTTLRQAMAVLGPGKIVETGDAAASLARLCYKSADQMDPVFLILMSDEMGGGETVMGFQLSRADERLGLDLECSRLAVPARRIVVPGLSLSAPKQALLANLGPAQADSGGFMRYERERNVLWRSRWGEDKGKLVELGEWSALDLEFDGERLVWLQAWKTTSDPAP